jgi:hypothetical protein
MNYRGSVGRIVFLALFVGISPPTAFGADYYIAPDGKSTNQATRDSPWPLDQANAAAKSGDMVVLLDGAYDKPIAPVHRGEPGGPITFKALNTGKAVFGGSSFDKQEAIVLSDRSYIVIDAVTVKHAKRFIFAEGEATHHITVKNCWFENASQGSFESCRFRGVGDGICVSNCHITGGNDLLAITGGKEHLVEGNFFGDASHTGLVLIMAQRSVVRNNHFTNRQAKMMEVFNTRDVKEPHRLAEYNLIEGNFFDTAAGSGIQYAGSRTILRRNIFRRCNIAIEWTNYLGSAKNPEAWYGENNRFYNNVLFDCGPATPKALVQRGITSAASGEATAHGVAMEFTTNRIPPTHYGDERCVNNIIYHNTAAGDKTAGTAQISFNWDATPSFGLFFYNDILAKTPGEPISYWLDAPRQKPPVKQNMSLQELEASYPRQAAHNLEAEPQFVDSANGDFHLKPTSPCLDAGGPLTTVATNARGKIVKVTDALFFTDGYGIQDLDGDVLRGDILRIGDQRARVVKVNYDRKELTLDQPIQSEAGAPVYLDFLGKGPDIGALECK